MNILLVEDDPGIGRGLSISLEAEGFQVTWAKDLYSASEKFSEDHRLVILDLNLPDGNGLSFLRKMRKEHSSVPVIILTAQSDEDSVVEGLISGANDYVKKPFNHRELLARIRVGLRETQKLDPELKYGSLQVYLDVRKITSHDREIELNRREFDLLHYMITRAEAVMTREALLQRFDKDGEVFDRTIDSHVSHIRSRLKKANVDDVQITSIYGVGYRLELKQPARSK